MPGKYLNQETKQQLQAERRMRKAAVSTVTRWAVILVVAVIILLNLFTHVLQIVRYNGDAMEPNLHSGQTLVLLRTQEVSEGDIIAFYYNNQVLVRRVVCTGGKQITIQSDGTVLVNQAVLEEPYLEASSIGQCNTAFPYHVRSGSVFVMGDNRPVSMDSRLVEIGTIPMERIIGRVIFAI